MIRLKAFSILLLFACGLWAQHSIQLKTRRLSDTGNPPVLHLARGHYILGFASHPDRSLRAALARRGIQVLQYVPDSALLVSVASSASLEGMNVTLAAALEPTDKIAPGLENMATNTYLVIFHADTELARARDLARSSGFDLIEHSSLPPNHLVAIGSFDHLRHLAANDEVQYVLAAPPALVSGAPAAPCNGAITEAGPVGDYVLVGRGWPKDQSGEVKLKYVIQSLTEKVDANTARSEIERAIREWTRYANVSLTPGMASDLLRTIAIRFAHGQHGDDYPFDGPGNILAHTFYPAPPNSEPAAGDLHLDSAEDWKTANGGLDLFSVVLHEVGHALGLGHSTNPGAVMYPYYRVVSGLAADDISGIQELYGGPAAPVQPPASSNGPGLQPPANPPITPPVTPPSTPSGPTEPPLQPPTTPTQPPAQPPAGPTGPTEPPLQPPTTPTQPPAQPPAQPTQPTNPPVQPPVTSSGKDTTAPTLRIVSPATTIVSTTAASISMSGTASDNTGVTAVSWTTSSGDTGTAAGTTAWSATIPLFVGTNMVSIRASDGAGNSSWRAVTVVRR